MEVQETLTESVKEISEESLEPAMEDIQMPLEEKSDSELREKYYELLKIVADCQKTSRLSSDRLQKLTEDLQGVADCYDLVLIDAEEKTAAIDNLRSETKSLSDEIATLKDENNIQADENAYLKGRYDRERSSKTFMSISGIAGLTADNSFRYGVGFDIGCRIGKHIMVGVGADYMLDKDLLELDLHKNNLRARCSLGWMF